MKTSLVSTAMHQATHLVREQNVIEATRVVQRALSRETERYHWETLRWSPRDV
jgi:hypothetical protein